MPNTYELAERIANLLEQEGWQVEDLLHIDEMRNEKKRQTKNAETNN